MFRKQPEGDARIESLPQRIRGCEVWYIVSLSTGYCCAVRNIIPISKIYHQEVEYGVPPNSDFRS